MIPAILLVASLLLDRLLGEPARLHPLVGFGRMASQIEGRLNAQSGSSRWRGLLSLVLLVAPPVLAAYWAERATELVGLPLLYLALGGRSLAVHAKRVHSALVACDLERSRQQVGRIVSRDTSQMQSGDVVRATVESVLENGSDAVFGALFWFAVAGAPGVVAYRLVNTLDAMWGYKTDRFSKFGWAAARLDDLMNLVPARLTALSYSLVGDLGQGLRCWRKQARAWESPNAGPVMAAGAGALCVRLGGPAQYHGKLHQRPVLGEGSPPSTSTILKAIRMVELSTLVWVTAVLVGGWAFA